jgi:hypothetical protein
VAGLRLEDDGRVLARREERAGSAQHLELVPLDVDLHQAGAGIPVSRA